MASKIIKDCPRCKPEPESPVDALETQDEVDDEFDDLSCDRDDLSDLMDESGGDLESALDTILKGK